MPSENRIRLKLSRPTPTRQPRGDGLTGFVSIEPDGIVWGQYTAIRRSAQYNAIFQREDRRNQGKRAQARQAKDRTLGSLAEICASFDRNLIISRMAMGAGTGLSA